MNRKILVADDSASMRQMLSITLAEAGFEVLAAIDGIDAWFKAPTFLPNMIITDLNMPNLNGIELIRNLRTHPNFKFIPIIMLTTESQEFKKQEGKAAGATGWMVKPFRPEQLLAVVKKVLV
jgi:two-component system chemotaxis response regulator CheY